MNKTDPRVDAFLRHVPQWREELLALREIMLETDLTESYKWGQPCYTYNDKNLVLLGGFASSFVVSFFNGSLLQDPEGILEFAGLNSRVAKVLRFTDGSQIAPLETMIKSYVAESIVLEQTGIKIQTSPANELPVPKELLDAFARFKGLEQAFYALTPGRQRGYLMHVASAKQAATRTSRIEKCVDKILDGKGLQE
jgi:uncharacterized protein YdeI (YjbR/CyaY-like superfamily)